MTSERTERARQAGHYYYVTQVDQLRNHLNAMRHHYTDLRQRADAGSTNAARFIPETEADIKATLVRLSELGAI